MWRKWCLLLLAPVFILLAGCAVTRSSERVKIGADLPLTGSFAEYGQEILAGMKLYQEEAAARGVHFDLIVIDNGSEALGTQKAFKELVERHHVEVVVGDYSSTNTFILKPLALKYHVPVITPTATNDEVTTANPYIFRTCFNDSFQGQALAWYLKHQTKLRRIGAFYNLDLDGGDYSRGLNYTLTLAFEKNGGKIKEVGYRSGQKDYTAELRELQQADVEAVFAPFYPDDVVRLLDSAARIHFTPVFFGGDGWSEDEVLRSGNPRAVGSFYGCMFADESSAPATVAFIKLLRQKKLSPGMCIAQGYDTAGILVSILKPDMDGDSIREALAGKVINYPGVTGLTTICPDGNAIKQVFIKQIYYDQTSRRLEDKIVYLVNPGDLEKP